MSTERLLRSGCNSEDLIRDIQKIEVSNVSVFRTICKCTKYLDIGVHGIRVEHGMWPPRPLLLNGLHASKRSVASNSPTRQNPAHGNDQKSRTLNCNCGRTVLEHFISCAVNA